MIDHQPTPPTPDPALATFLRTLPPGSALVYYHGVTGIIIDHNPIDDGWHLVVGRVTAPVPDLILSFPTSALVYAALVLLQDRLDDPLPGLLDRASWSLTTLAALGLPAAPARGPRLPA